MPTFRSPLLLPLLPLPLLPLFSSLAQAARAMLPASSSTAAFVIRARRKTISSRGGRGPPSGGARPERRGPAPPPDRLQPFRGDTSEGNASRVRGRSEGSETRSLSAEDSGSALVRIVSRRNGLACGHVRFRLGSARARRRRRVAHDGGRPAGRSPRGAGGPQHDA